MKRMSRFKRLASAVWDFFDPCGQSKYAAKCADIRLRAQGLAIEGKSHRETMAEAMMILSEQMHEHEGPYVGSLCEEAASLLREAHGNGMTCDGKTMAINASEMRRSAIIGCGNDYRGLRAAYWWLAIDSPLGDHPVFLAMESRFPKTLYDGMVNP